MNWGNQFAFNISFCKNISVRDETKKINLIFFRLVYHFLRLFENLGGTLYSGVLVFFTSTQNQVAQRITELGWVIYHNKAHSVVIGTIFFFNFKIFFHEVKKTGLKFLILV